MHGVTCRSWAGLLAVLCAGAACASLVAETERGYRHRKHGYRIGAPGGPGGPWTRVEVEDAALAFRRRGPDSLSLQSRCGKPVTDPQLMARHLRIGIPLSELIHSGPVEVDGRSGWTQTFDTVHDDVDVRVKTITLVVGRCSFDWVLASAGSFATVEAAFDAWWGSFQLEIDRDERREP
jgi:hypothetical protein